MNFKTFLFALLVAASLLFSGSYKEANSKAPALSIELTLNGEDYTYVYQNVEGVMWVFVYDKDGNLVTAYPLE
ncbi:MAG: hypothetical protein JSS63_01350 [Bacteroidetes bacterium]|nr:hypothetical protein [Bacteroidota bacterium]MBX7045656.1 hypothetical protein [Ignavibacteria bacterium]